MAKVTITVDTEEKEVEVSIDGKKVENVDYVSVYTEQSGYFGFSVSSSVKQDNGLRYWESISAEAKDGAKASTKYPGLFEASKNFSTEDLSKVLLRRDV